MNYSELRGAADLMNEHQNVFLEISCLQMRDPLAAAIKLARASRILFGTEGPLPYAGCSLAKVRDTGLPAGVIDAVCSVNAKSVFRLP